jgi:SAM-dependent methyltransferase
MSFGGVLGGAFNVLVAPLLFDSLVEYAVALVIAFSLRPPPDPAAGTVRFRFTDVAYPLVLGTVIWLVYELPTPPEEWFAMGSQLFLVAAMFTLFFFWKRPLRLALGAAAMYAAVQLAGNATGNIVMQDRSFFGMYRVRRVSEFHIFQHGTTNHGGQSINPARRTEPLTYYYRGGPVTDLFQNLSRKPVRRVAIVGLGAGAIACYGRPEEAWTFYEIDPLVAEIAREPSWFSYLRDCAPRIDVVIGDARLQLVAAPDSEFDIIVLDAFSSDAVPVHLITREAVALYLKKLRPDGVMIFNISNRYIDLEPVLTTLAREARLSGALGERTPAIDDVRLRLHDGSKWVVLARDPSAVADLVKVEGWKPLGSTSPARLWTDDYTDVVAVLRW